MVNRTSGTVTVTDYMANVEQVERYLRMIEARVRTGVVIETRIMEVTLDDSTKYGIDWTALPDLSSLSLSGSLAGGATAVQGLSTGPRRSGSASPARSSTRSWTPRPRRGT